MSIDSSVRIHSRGKPAFSTVSGETLCNPPTVQVLVVFHPSVHAYSQAAPRWLDLALA